METWNQTEMDEDGVSACAAPTSRLLSNFRPYGGFPVMSKITSKLAANTRTQFSSVIITTECTRGLVKSFQLSCCSQQVSPMWQYDDSVSLSKWPNDQMVVVVKHCWLLVHGRRGCRERWPKIPQDKV